MADHKRLGMEFSTCGITLVLKLLSKLECSGLLIWGLGMIEIDKYIIDSDLRYRW